MKVERRVMLVHSLDRENISFVRRFLVDLSLSKMIPSTQGNLIRKDWDPLVVEATIVGLELLEERLAKAFGEGQK
jgi:hypothetical protein